ncbi:MAG: hypothetical protein PHQ97_11245 [Desulfobacterales bacterium]|nr:hypothetical protein [Desulfobacterales bacterium]
MSKNHFGVCPKCGEVDSILNINRDHWAVCFLCQTKWQIGSNLFSSWQDENKKIWDRNALILSQYTEVEPIAAAGEDEQEEKTLHEDSPF